MKVLEFSARSFQSGSEMLAGLEGLCQGQLAALSAIFSRRAWNLRNFAKLGPWRNCQAVCKPQRVAHKGQGIDAGVQTGLTTTGHDQPQHDSP